jgi:hypothetical protein
VGRTARRRLPVLLALVTVLPAAAEAWPAIQDASGLVHLCDGRPAQLPDGAWSCRTGAGMPAGALVDVVRPGTPPGVRPWDVPRGPYRHVPFPWGLSPRDPSGYDALDPWLGPRSGGSER